LVTCGFCHACCFLLLLLLLQDMLSDANPMVVANALAALQEIQEISGKEVLQITSHMLFKLLAALNECTEWGQVRWWQRCSRGRGCTTARWLGAAGAAW
jgi:vesicle coat complex subunit